MATPEEKSRIRRECTRFLYAHQRLRPAEDFLKMAEWCRSEGTSADVYGDGPLIKAFEEKVAGLLGKEAAVFMPSGTMAQQIALRIWSDGARTKQVAMHPTSHLELHEHRGYAQLHGLQATLIGEAHRPMLASDLDACPATPAAVITELPLREAGGLLPAWPELNALKAKCAQRGIKLHMDGARLWECREFYAGHSYAEICAGFDSVYVSFYKGIGGIGGAMLAGSKDFAAESRIWLRRHGGNLFTLHPLVVSAAMDFDRRLEAMPALYERAVSLANALTGGDNLAVSPSKPHVNMFHVFLRGSPLALEEAHLKMARERKLWITGSFRPASVPGWSSFEVYIGDNALGLSDADVRDALEQIVADAGPAS